MPRKKVNYAQKLNKKTRAHFSDEGKQEKTSKTLVKNHEQQSEMPLEPKIQKVDKPFVSKIRQIDNLWAQKDLLQIFLFFGFVILLIIIIFFVNEKFDFLDKISGKILNIID